MCVAHSFVPHVSVPKGEDPRVDLVSFEHLDAWLAVLARVATRLATEVAR